MSIAQDLRNRNVKCKGKSVIRDNHNLPILDEDGARQYKPCGNWAANGTEWCQKHGGGFSSTIAAARRRLLYGADDIVEILERIAKDETLPAKERIAAINSYLDRAGIRSGQEVSIEMPGWQKALGEMFGAEGSSTQDEAATPEAGTVWHEGDGSATIVAAPAKQRKAAKPVAPSPSAEETKRVAKKAARGKASPPSQMGKPKPSFEGWE